MRVGARVRIHRGDCRSGAHEGHFGKDGDVGTVIGLWAGSPGGDGEHEYGVQFVEGGEIVAMYSYRADELMPVRRKIRRPAAVDHDAATTTGADGHGEEGS